MQKYLLRRCDSAVHILRRPSRNACYDFTSRYVIDGSDDINAQIHSCCIPGLTTLDKLIYQLQRCLYTIEDVLDGGSVHRRDPFTIYEKSVTTVPLSGPIQIVLRRLTQC
jgi:hypothetical protein